MVVAVVGAAIVIGAVVGIVIISDTVVAGAVVGIVIIGDAIVIGTVVGIVIVSDAVVAGAVIRILVIRQAEEGFAFHINGGGPVVVFHDLLHFCDHIVQESAGRQAGTGFDLNGDLAGVSFDLLHKIAGVANGGYQLAHHLLSGLADITGNVCQDFLGFFIAGNQLCNITVFIIAYGDLRIYPQAQGSAGCQLGRAGADRLGSCAAAGEGADTQHQCQKDC